MELENRTKIRFPVWATPLNGSMNGGDLRKIVNFMQRAKQGREAAHAALAREKKRGGRPPPTNGRRPRGPLGGGGPQPPTGRLRPGGCGPPPTNGRRVFYVSRLPLVWILQSSARACKPIYCERQTRPDGRKRPPPGVFVALPFLPDDDCSGLTQKTQKKREK